MRAKIRWSRPHGPQVIIEAVATSLAVNGNPTLKRLFYASSGTSSVDPFGLSGHSAGEQRKIDQ